LSTTEGISKNRGRRKAERLARKQSATRIKGVEGARLGESARPMVSTDPHINFEAPATLYKWPSLNNERRAAGSGPYLLVDGTLDECIREFMAKPASIRHLYEIHTSPQPLLVSAILSEEIVAELARLRDFL
jgi:hypothetical protein